LGLEGGILWPGKLQGNASFDALTFIPFVCLPERSLCEEVPEHFVAEDAASAKLKRGADVDAIAGYDFGWFRLEAELGWKRTKSKGLDIDAGFLDYFNAVLRRPSAPPDPGAPGMPAVTSAAFDTPNGKIVAKSAMINLLADVAATKRITFYGGGGFGRVWARALGDRDSAWAAQAIAGVRTSLRPNVEVGLKYRYFRTSSLNFAGRPIEFAGNPHVEFAGGLMLVEQDSAAITPQLSDRLHSHSILASLTFNFGAPSQ
jgi:opacity protein-like surface antigen